ncbi:MAG: hypothetical protein ACLQNE_17735 [Thermoguttaceae bacterium]
MSLRRNIVALGCLAILCATIVAPPAPGADPPGQIVLTLCSQVETRAGSGQFRATEKKVAWETKKTAVIVCDMWARHWCAGAVQRCAEMCPRMNALLVALRNRGVLVVHAPSGAMDLYKDHPARKRAQSAPKAADLPAGIDQWCNQIEAEKKGKYPIDQSDGGCDDLPRCPDRAMDIHQAAALEIRDEDAISDRGAEVWNLFQQRGISNVMLLGVHTNMCVLGRPFGLRNMARFGKNVVLVRDLTDTMYNSRAWPQVSHFHGTELIVEHIEKFVCPTVTSDQVLGGKPFRFAGDTRPFEGRYCRGEGDRDCLKLIDESFAFFHPTPNVPNLTMVYQPEWDTFCEGAGWGGWWIQNSYGFSYAATPFLQEPWVSTLQRSWDLFWDNQGDGKRKGLWGGTPTANHLSALVAPDGCLGDAATPGCIAYKQGDGDSKVHDWFYEATAAGIVMEAEILLVSRDPKAIVKYLPKMERACDFIEKTRNPNNGLFLVGPACNLLAPSYGGVKQPDGNFGKGYLAGLSITYLAALDRMVELYRMSGDRAKLAEYQRRQTMTRHSLPKLLTLAGYFIKSVEPGGTMHGVVGQKKFGYLEGVANVDAVALRVADDATARSIYRQIESFPAIRPFDFLLTNAPGLDDTYWNYGSTDVGGGFNKFGDWVNGGVWGTVEGRAILAYSRLGKFDDIRRSATRAMKWAKDFRMDAPWSQRGENTNNPWSDSGGNQVGGVAVMIDNFAIPAATLRGLFDYEYRFDRLVLRPRVPASITEYVQKHPVRFGVKTLYLSCRNGGPKIQSVAVNGKPIKVESPDVAVLAYDELPARSDIRIVTEGGWTAGPAVASAPQPQEASAAMVSQGQLPQSLKRPYAVLTAMERLLTQGPGGDYELAFVRESLGAIEAWRGRSAVEMPGFFRLMTAAKRASILKFYENAALGMYDGLARRIAAYAQSPDAAKKRMAELFQQACDSVQPKP